VQPDPVSLDGRPLSEQRQDVTLAHPPIVEAVLDIEWDLPPGIRILELEEKATQAVGTEYPAISRLIANQFEVRSGALIAHRDGTQRISGIQFRTSDGRQVLQLREEGYSFNRLAPYSSFDDYLPAIERSWNIGRNLAVPVQIRAIRLRFLNRILLPTKGGSVTLPDYLRTSPRVPDDSLVFTGFLNQHSTYEEATGNEVKTTLQTQPPENGRLPVILDIETSDLRARSPEDWPAIREAILSLRRLANRVFEGTLTQECLNLFRQP
jgi:uncharacterized protein (TIGR04255 family)